MLRSDGNPLFVFRVRLVVGVVVEDKVVRLVNVGLFRRAGSGSDELDGRDGVRRDRVGIRGGVVLSLDAVRNLVGDSLAKLHKHGSASERLSGNVEGPCLDWSSSGAQDGKVVEDDHLELLKTLRELGSAIVLESDETVEELHTEGIKLATISTSV